MSWDKRIWRNMVEKPQWPQSRAMVETSPPQNAPPHTLANYHMWWVKIWFFGTFFGWKCYFWGIFWGVIKTEKKPSHGGDRPTTLPHTLALVIPHANMISFGWQKIPLCQFTHGGGTGDGGNENVIYLLREYVQILPGRGGLDNPGNPRIFTYLNWLKVILP